MIAIIKQRELPLRHGSDIMFEETVAMIAFHEFLIVEKFCRQSGWAGTKWHNGSRKTFDDSERNKAEVWYELLCAGEEWCLEDKLKAAFPD